MQGCRFNPDPGMNIPHATKQLSPCANTTEARVLEPTSCHYQACTPQLERAHALQWKTLHDEMKTVCATIKTWWSQINVKNPKSYASTRKNTMCSFINAEWGRPFCDSKFRDSEREDLTNSTTYIKNVFVAKITYQVKRQWKYLLLRT